MQTMLAKRPLSFLLQKLMERLMLKKLLIVVSVQTTNLLLFVHRLS
jgi:hypothetical protein